MPTLIGLRSAYHVRVHKLKDFGLRLVPIDIAFHTFVSFLYRMEIKDQKLLLFQQNEQQDMQ